MTITLDDLDLRILGVLQVDASISNIDLAERVHASAPTCLRRVRKLKASGVIQREIAVLDYARIAPRLIAIIEVSLDRQSAEDLEQFEHYLAREPHVTQCYRVSPGPDFIVTVDVADMAGYDELARRLFRSSSNVRNVRTFFATHRAKFEANAPVHLLQPTAS